MTFGYISEQNDINESTEVCTKNNDSRKHSAVVTKKNLFQYWQNHCFIKLNLLWCTRKHSVVRERLDRCSRQSSVLDAHFSAISTDVHNAVGALSFLLTAQWSVQKYNFIIVSCTLSITTTTKKHKKLLVITTGHHSIISVCLLWLHY